jgi:hypothetical protein
MRHAALASQGPCKKRCAKVQDDLVEMADGKNKPQNDAQKFTRYISG